MNVCMFAGNLTRDPETHHGKGGKDFVTFSVAVNDYKKNPATGKSEQETLFIDCVAFEKKAELIARDMTKGSGIIIQAKAVLDQWKDKTTGDNRFKMKFLVNNFNYPPGGKKNESANGGTRAASTKQADDDKVPSYGNFPTDDFNVDETEIPF